MNDPGEDITDALVEYVKDLEDLSLTALVRKTDNPLGDLEFENTDLTVLLHAMSEGSIKRGRNGVFQEDFTIAMLVVRKMDAEFTRSVLARFTRELKYAIRGRKMMGYAFSTDETSVKFDPIQRKEANQFVSVSQFTYTGFPQCASS